MARPYGRALGRRYGRGRAAVRGRSHSGFRPVEELLRAQDAPTRQAPRLTMLEQLEWDRALREVREAEKKRG